MSWTEEKVNKLKELWGKGNTASQIAEIIGGISRNAVIGKAHRLNLSAKIKTRSATSNLPAVAIGCNPAEPGDFGITVPGTNETLSGFITPSSSI